MAISILKRKKPKPNQTQRQHLGEREGRDTLKWNLYLAFSTRLLLSIIFSLSCSKDLSIEVQVWYALCISVFRDLNSVNKQKQRVQGENSNLAAA